MPAVWLAATLSALLGLPLSPFAEFMGESNQFL